MRALTRNAIPSFAAMATVLVTVLVLGVFIPVVQATTGAANEVRSKVIADVYLKPRATEADMRPRAAACSRARPRTSGASCSSPRTQAYAEERKRNPEAYDLLGANPLPDTFRVTPDSPDNITAMRDALAPLSPAGERTTVDPAIDEVRNREEDTNKILSVTRVVKLTMGLLAGPARDRLAAADRQHHPALALRAPPRGRGHEARRRDGLVHPLAVRDRGRSSSGALGGVLAVLMLGVVKVAVVDPLAADFALVAAPETMNFALLIAVLLGAAVGRLGARLRALAAALPAV